MKIAVFDDLLSKKMTRKEFLLHVGLLLFVVTGISGLLKALSDPHLVSKQKRSSSGFGAGPYGV